MDAPEHIVVIPPVMLQVGFGLAVKVLEHVVTQPNELVIVTLYAPALLAIALLIVIVSLNDVKLLGPDHE